MLTEPAKSTFYQPCSSRPNRYHAQQLFLMRVFIFDTETTGFPLRDGRLDQQPYVVQLAGILFDITSTGEHTEIERYNQLFKPPVAIPFGASQVHGIYDQHVVDKGPFADQIDTILKYLNGADLVSGHNIEFDEQILSYELQRAGRKGDYTPMKTLCTMRSSTEYCNLAGRGFAAKPPRLNELHKHLFGQWFE